MLKWRARLSRNAKWLLVTELGWSMPMPSILYYQPVYVTALGFSEVEYGLFASASRGFSIVTPLAAVPLASRLGFKRGFLLIDLAANAGFLLPLIAGARELVPVAFIFTSLLSASGILWEVLLVTGTDHEALVPAYSLPSVIYIVGSSLPPLAGAVMERLGVIDGYRLVAAAALASFLAKTAALAVKLEEPRESSPGVAHSPSLRQSLKNVFSDSRLRLLLLYSTLSMILWSVLGYLSLYLCDARGARMRVEEAGLVSTVSSAASLLVIAAVTIRPPNPVKYMLGATVASLLAHALYALSGAEPRLAFLAAALSGLRGAEFSVSRALFIGLLDSSAIGRGHAISLAYTLGNIVSVPAPALIGFLYSVNPINIWVVAFSVTLAQLVSLALLRETARRA